jgi:hypothetical protein
VALVVEEGVESNKVEPRLNVLGGCSYSCDTRGAVMDETLRVAGFEIVVTGPGKFEATMCTGPFWLCGVLPNAYVDRIELMITR